MIINVNGDVQNKIRKIKLLILDVDGVLTDGRIIIDDDGNESKHFDVKDGHGLKLIMRYGIDVVLLTGRSSAVVKHRADDLGIREVYQGVLKKLEFFQTYIEEKKLDPENVGYIGDDVVDIPVLRRTGFSVAVSDASAEVKEVADYVTERPGGRGAVREICDLMLKVQGKWDEVARRYELE
ncbi:MAG: 3-deoxy-D-manno-octulosonate 8-phosphate phosphatase KdsC [Syntrophus sp. PtaB.Bin001]|nr:MAG: 3-deoxy-D-manno-octulosonate 8-phosphate phosphatase KdsC [Syntrophus sp. PtaB.Bin001]